VTTRVRVALDKVDAELGKLWEVAGTETKGVTRVQTTNVVALCETPAHAAIAEPALAAASAVHGARTVLVTWHQAAAGAGPAITADVALHQSLRPGIPGGEAIWLEATGKSREWVPDSVGRLLTADLPVYVWWVGDLPDHDDLFDRVAAVADVAIFNSNDMDLRDLPALDRLAERPIGRSVLADFCWHRLRTWQEMSARFFDEPQCLDDLARLERVTIRFHQRSEKPEPVSNQAALFAGWLASRLGLRLQAWTSRDPRAPTARLACIRGEGPGVEIRFEAHTRPGVLPGALVEVELVAPEAEFHVCRVVEDPAVICWTAKRPGVPFPQQCVRIGIPDEAKLLTRVLERPLRDPLFEASLH
jgi:glucose-6-phosphate dehydrogenase assembly protein OpcA